LGCEGIVSKQLGSIYRRGRSPPNLATLSSVSFAMLTAIRRATWRMKTAICPKKARCDRPD
jgi:hypothetical protein